jgi:hypothetical protein
MKKITKPAEKEEATYYSDFTGKVLNGQVPDVDFKLTFNPNSKYYGASLDLHLNDEDTALIIKLVKQNLTTDIKDTFKRKLNKLEEDFSDSMQMRDWDYCDVLTNSIYFLKELLDIKD